MPTDELQIIDSYYTTSATVGKLFTAIATAQLELEPAAKDAKNPDKGNRYASLPAVLAATKVYAKNGVAIVQPVSTNGSIVSVTTILGHGEEWISSTMSLQAMVMRKGGVFETMIDPQSIGSAITYARRYALAAVCLIAQDDDDGEKASKAAKEAAAQAKAEAESASMFGTVAPDAPKAEAPKAPAKTKEPKPPSALAQKRIDEETKKLESTKAGPPEGTQDRLEWFMSKDRTKFEHWDEFGRVKADMIEVLGDSGEPKYYDILAGFNVKKANEFSRREDSVAAYKMMLDVVQSALAKPIEADPAKDDWLPEMKEQAA